jgi:cell division protein FtsZ
MIQYNRDSQQTILSSAVKIIGLGGAGVNMLGRMALDGLDGSELLAINTDVRTLTACPAREKIQLGVSLTKGLGSGGDPELGRQAVMEAEDQLRASIKDRRIVFLCVGLGGGTGSGAAPIVTRIAREEGAFVVVFASMPFAFEGRRRRDQAETSLNELAVLSNALVTFDNNRMGELVLAKQGIHEAFAAADQMICESIKAVIRLVIRPGLINVGLDDLMSALRTNRSRCLFGSGIADGKDRATKALRNALNSPLLDQGTLLREAQTVLVHLSGGENLTLFEIELLMQRLQKFVPENAHVLFGAAIDPAMGESLSITLISALPEDSLALPPRESISGNSTEVSNRPPTPAAAAPPAQFTVAADASLPTEPTLPRPAAPIETPVTSSPPQPAPTPLANDGLPSLFENERPFAESNSVAKTQSEAPAASAASVSIFTAITTPEPEQTPPAAEWAEFIPEEETAAETFIEVPRYHAAEEENPEPIEAVEPEPEPETSARPGFTPLPKRKSASVNRWIGPKVVDPTPVFNELNENTPVVLVPETKVLKEAQPPKLKLGVKSSGAQNELSLDATPRGRFEGETPSVFEGEDLDLPPFLRKKK